jgi:hypothetical protein
MCWVEVRGWGVGWGVAVARVAVGADTAAGLVERGMAARAVVVVTRRWGIRAGKAKSMGRAVARRGGAPEARWLLCLPAKGRTGSVAVEL